MDFLCKPGETWYLDGKTEVKIAGYIFNFTGEPLIVLDRFLPDCIFDDAADNLRAAGLLHQAVDASYFVENFSREKKQKRCEKKMICDNCGHRLSLGITETQEYTLSDDGSVAEALLFQLERPVSRKMELSCPNCGKVYPYKLDRKTTGISRIVRM